MAVNQVHLLDRTELLMQAYELSDMIKHSVEVADYRYWRAEVDRHPDSPRLIAALNQAKVLFAESERFGHFHPNYHEAKEQVEAAVAALDELEPVRRFKAAETRLDLLLQEVCQTIARSVSETIKVPGSESSGNSCNSGGGCSGHCG